MVHTSESIKTKFILSISGTVVFFLMLLLFMSYSLLRDTAVKNARELSQTILAETDKQIDTFFMEIEHLTRSMTGFPAFYELRLDEMRTIILSTVRARSEYLRAIYLGTTDGEMHEWGIGEGFVDHAPVFEAGYDPRQRPWYQEAVEAGGFTITKPYIYASVSALGITGVQPLYHPNGEFVGVLGLDIMLDDLKRMIEELKLQKGGRVILLNQENKTIVNQFSASPDVLELKEFNLFDVSELSRETDSHFITTFDNGERYYITSTQNRMTGWKVLVALPYEAVMAQATDSIRLIVSFDILLMMMLSVVIGFFSNRIIIHPLKATVDVMQRLERGESDARVEINRNDEFGTLARQFNRLIGIVNDYRKSLEEKVERRTRKIADLQQENVRLRIIEEKERIYGYLHDSLGARLTNIFISNNVAQSAVQKDPQVLQDMLEQIERNTQQAIGDLKEILFSSQDEGRKIIDFPKLIRHHIKERLSLKNISFTYSISDPEELNELDREARFEIEKILQELVSNTLKHSQASKVELVLDTVSGRIKIHYSDNGVGFDKSVIEEQGFGLQNMQHRIENLSGSFELKTEPGHGVNINIELPMELKERSTL
ncbi:MAG: HAMP domain-containing protein [Spirochaetaceae bacterium]|nr:HAMP domain-containing protein [Spirochaetaceae bacterium]MCF7952046.1 HAMP domain-containing protein [Spirochaetaceae bacterium]